MMPRNADFLRQQQERRDTRITRIAAAFVGFFWLVIILCVVWLARHPREVGEFFSLLAAGLGMDRY